MKCPYCGCLETRVTDSRTTESGDAIRRRRQCQSCAQRFTTFERLEETPITVIKKGGLAEPFDRGKLMAGLLRATVKRQISREQLDQLVSDIESDLRNQFKYEITTRALGEMVLDQLRRVDKVAYVRFASVYREFQDIDEFTSEMGQLQPGRKKRASRRRK